MYPFGGARGSGSDSQLQVERGTQTLLNKELDGVGWGEIGEGDGETGRGPENGGGEGTWWVDIFACMFWTHSTYAAETQTVSTHHQHYRVCFHFIVNSPVQEKVNRQGNKTKKSALYRIQNQIENTEWK